MVLIKKNEIQSFQVDDATIINNYEFSTEAYDIVEINVNGFHGTMTNKKSTKTYYATTGKAIFNINEEKYEVEAGDVISIKPRTWLSIQGQNFKALIITNPPFNPNDEEFK